MSKIDEADEMLRKLGQHAVRLTFDELEVLIAFAEFLENRKRADTKLEDAAFRLAMRAFKERR